jgi:hypothetical protein
VVPKQYNSVLNKTPVSYKSNRMIGGRAPADYLRQLQEHKSVVLDAAGMDAILRSHFIEPSYLRNNDYSGFIESRRALLLAEIARAMGKPPVETVNSTEDDDEADIS